MSVAEIIKFQPKEVRMADLDDGYTRIANELLEKIISSQLTSRQLNVLLAIARKTYGYNKKIDWIGNKQLSALTGYAETRCSTIKNELISMNIVISNGRECGINKNLNDWNLDITHSGKTFTKKGKETFTKTVKRSLPKEVNTKDNITKEKRNIKHMSSGNDDQTEIKPKNQKAKYDYQGIIEAYRDVVLDGLPVPDELNAKRKTLINKLAPKLKNADASTFKAYFARFMDLIENNPFYFGGENRRAWKATFDYVLRLDTLTKVKEDAL